MRTLGVVATLVLATGTAHALKPGTHADIAKSSCLDARLPRDLCQRIATEDYNTDEREWDDLRAHAQIDDGQTACVAADAAASRVWGLGHDLSAALLAVKASANKTTVGTVDSLIGRALHTIQDNCAHHGMPNPQHAWFSLQDFCEGTTTSPDVQDDALRCARTETAALMATVAAKVNQLGVSRALSSYSCPPSFNSQRNSSQPAVCDGRYLPGPFDACGFLGRAKDWDGIDRTWNNDVVTSMLREAFSDGLAGADAPPPICGGDETVLSRAVSAPIVDISGGTPSCGRASFFCLGKADDSDNPFADDPTVDDSAGCNATGGSFGGAWLVAVALLGVRRRRRLPN